MHLFHNDYNQTAHPAVLEKITGELHVQHPGYGTDDCCKRAADLIRTLCKKADASVHFMVGGTQANLAVIASVLRPHQSVLGAASAHVNVHETGAIEATGHKVETLPSADGKLTAAQIEAFCYKQQQEREPEHAVQTKLVYISHPTEMGTTYRLSELEAISAVCKKYGMYLYLDGARLGYALAAADNDVSIADLARLCDVFYIGGTKVGAMFGEAVVFANTSLATDFRYVIKQRGALLAKGWLLGKQFEALFTDGLYVSIAEHAVRLADKLRETIAQCGYKLLVPGSTNQVFVILPNKLLDKLSKEFLVMLQERIDDENSAVRICTSWATDEASVDALCEAIRKY